MTLKPTLYMRFLAWTMLLLVFLVGTILFVIQRKEVRTIFEETKNRGILTAQYLANMNLRPLVLWDEETLRMNIEGQADDKLIFIVFYDRNGKPRAANRLVAANDEITCCSGLLGEARPDSASIRAREIRIRNRKLNILEIELPVFVTGSPTRWASIKIGYSLEDMRADVRRTRWVLILIGLGGLLVGLAGSSLLAKRITRPLKELVEGTIRISRGDFSHRIRLASADELGDLARSFNEMTGRLLEAREHMEAVHRKLVQAEKLASIGRLSATIAHEIRNPLTSVKLNIQRIAESEHLDAIEREHLDICQEGVGQIEKFIKELLEFTRVPALAREMFPIEQVLEESLKMLKDAFRQKRVTVERSYAQGLPPANVDGDRLRQVFLNLLRNAFEAVEEGGRISVALGSSGGTEMGAYVIRVSDSGCGIPEKDWENIFEPFFTTKSSGFGLGLANARKIVELHGGSIRVARKRGKGSTFIVTLPREEGQ
jgi:signal transduction histidine kinase